jgi:polysaccharide transporter, PST family
MYNIVKSFIGNSIFIMGAKALQILMPLITLPLILGSLPISEYGKFSSLLATSTLISVITQYGFLYFLPKKVSESQNNNELSKLLANVLFFQLACAFFMSVAYFFYIHVSGIEVNLKSAIVIYLFVTLQIITPIWFFQGLQKKVTILLLQLTSSLLLMIVLLITQTSLTLSLLSFNYLLVNCSVFLSALFLTKSIALNSWQYLSLNYIINLLQGGRSEFIQQIFPNLYNNGLVVLLSTQLDSQTFGIFSVALKVVNAFLGMITAACLASLPIIVRARKAVQPLNALVTLIGFILSVILYVFADVISNFLLSENSKEVSFYLRLLSPSPFFISISRAIGINYLNLIGKQKIAQRYTVQISVAFGVLGSSLIFYVPLIGFISSVMLARFSLALCGLYFHYIFTKGRRHV